jgi:plastocyanin
MKRRSMAPGAYALGLMFFIGGCGGGGAAPTEVAAPGTGTETGGGTTPPTPPAPPVPPAPPSTPTEPSAPMAVTITTVDRMFTSSEVTVAVGGTVTFVSDENSHDITFSPAVPGGDIVDLDEDAPMSRTFTTAGTYAFHCDRHEDGGTIHVVATGTGPTPPNTPPPSAPAATITTPGVSFSPATVTIQAGQTVAWQISGARHNVTFRSAQPTGGNIPDTDAGRTVTRTFAAAGSYPYDCTRHSGMSGTINVQ